MMGERTLLLFNKAKTTLARVLYASARAALPIAKRAVSSAVHTYIASRLGNVIVKYYPRKAILNTKVPIKKNLRPTPTKVTVHYHDARRAGLHYDFRFRYKYGKGKTYLVSWAVKKKPPKRFANNPEPEKPYVTRFIRQPDHIVEYEDFEGEIKQGYGAGIVKIDFQAPGVYWSDDKFVTVYTAPSPNPWSGIWKISLKGDLAIRVPISTPVWFPRNKYLNVKPTQFEDEKLSRKYERNDYIVERKVDGANFIVTLRAIGLEKDEEPKALKWVKHKGDEEHPDWWSTQSNKPLIELDPNKVIAFWRAEQLYGEGADGRIPVVLTYVSRRYSKAGYPIVRNGEVEHLVYAKLPAELVAKINGGVFRAELWHRKGVNFLSGVLNSSPELAMETQGRDKIRCMFFDFLGFVDKSRKNRVAFVNKPYMERRAVYEELVKELNQKYDKTDVWSLRDSGALFSTPDYVLDDRELSNGIKFYHKISREALPLGEGVVVKDPNGSPMDDWVKVKRVNTFDLLVVGVEPGKGRLEGWGAGKVLVADRTGNIVAKVGTGLDDDLRKWFWDNRNNPEVIGSLVVEVKAQDLGKEALRAPVLLRLRDDKTPDEIDIVPLKGHEEVIMEYLKGQGYKDPEEMTRVMYAFKSSLGWRANK